MAPRFRFPVYTLDRLWFNERLRLQHYDDCDFTVGFDMDGYRIPKDIKVRHVASIKGILADETRFESGLTRLTMSVQAACEARHVRRADLVMTTSRYSASRLAELYDIPEPRSIVPELIDLEGWRELFNRCAVIPDPQYFTLLCVCRFYRRKRLNLLLRAAARLKNRLPGLRVRIVGGGPELKRLLQVCREKRLEETVAWLGDLSQNELASEYKRCDAFCLPSVQEGFGIVFLEAMAAGKPIIAARAAAVPEVVRKGILVEPEDEEALAAAIETLYQDTPLRDSLAEAGLRAVEQYDAPVVARLFLAELERWFR